MGNPPASDPWYYERLAWGDGHAVVAGLDEAGRGPLAGPVVAAAVILTNDFDCSGVRDSKAMTPGLRGVAFDRILREARAVGVGIVGPDIIDKINILRATHRAMRLALEDLITALDYILVDGLPVPDLPAPSLAIVKGDSKSISIMAASVVAKVTRDRIMIELDQEFPNYGFISHKGYGTKDHLAAIERWGPCPCHRRSFAPVRERSEECRLPGLD